MKPMRNLITLIFLGSCLLFLNCKKITEQWPKTVVEGRVFDKFTGEGISDAIVGIKEDMYTTLISTKTNDLGYYKIKFHYKTSYPDLPIEVQSKYYNALPREHGLKRGKHNLINFSLTSPSGIDLTVRNIHPIADDDFIRVVFEAQGIGVDDFTYTGMSVNDFLPMYAAGNSKILLSWFVTKGGTLSGFSDSLIVPFDRRVNYAINY